MLAAAAENFLNWNTDDISAQVTDVLEGNLREIIGQMNLREMVNNRQEFAGKVQENVSPDLAKMGIEVIAFTVQSFEDQNNVILNQAEKAIDDYKFIFDDLEVLKDGGGEDLISVHYSRVLNSYLFKNENGYKNSSDPIDKYINRLNSDCTPLGLYLDIEFYVNHPVDKKKEILNDYLKKTLKYFTLNQLTKDVVGTICLEADRDG